MVSFAQQRGAVSILFLVMVLVVALAFGALWFVQLQKNEELQTKTDSARRNAEHAARQYVHAREYYNNIAGKVGAGVPTSLDITDEQLGVPVPELVGNIIKNIEGELATAGAQVDDPAARPTNLRESWDVFINAYKKMKTVVAQKDTEIAGLKADLAEKVKAISDATSAHSTELTKIQQENEANLSRVNSQLSATRTQQDELTTKTTQLVAENDKNREQANKEVQAAVGEKRELEAKVVQINSKNVVERATETPDGRVLAADPKSGIVWINLTSKDMLRRGLRFKVYETVKGGDKLHKGWVTVTNIGADMSEARIDEVIPGSGLIGAQDWLYSPIYSPKESVKFVFLGQLNGRHTRENAERILKHHGAKVADKVEVDTTFLVLGAKETEDADELTESENYKNAMTWGTEVLRAQDLSAFLQM